MTLCYISIVLNCTSKKKTTSFESNKSSSKHLIFLTKKLLNNLFHKFKIVKYDLVFVLDQGNKGWILDGICKEIAKYFPGKYYLCYGKFFPRGDIFSYSPQNFLLPPAKSYFFAHYSYFVVCLKNYPQLQNQKSFVFYTHPKGLMDDQNFAYALNQSKKVICMCSQFKEKLITCGVKPEKVTYILGAADPEMFQPHNRSGDGVVGFCTAYYPRKDPDRILEIVNLLPHRKFLLLGRKWELYERFSELISLPNFSYVEDPYSAYQKHYASMEVFVSPAKLEGGPIPLIEAMMCNVFPVASKTGFAPDLIQHGKNGFLFEVDSSAQKICELIEQAFQNQTDVRETVEHLSWKNFSIQMQNLFDLS